MSIDRGAMRKRARVGWATVVALLMMASAAGAESDSLESTGSVPSPFTYFDAVGDNPSSPFGDLPDFTAVQVHNGSNRVVLRFWLWDLRDPAVLDAIPAVFWIDLKANGAGVDYQMWVTSGGLRMVNAHHPRGDPTCNSSNVSDLGLNEWGHGFAARFRFRCIGGRRTLRTAVHNVLGGLDGDQAPDGGFTPYIRPTT
jgi:hypothetical protein